jgi:hypothetical protein
MAPDTRMPDPIARLVTHLADRYRLDGELGSGGMAVVYRAHDLRHDRPVALKVLRPELAAAIGAERFDREIRVAARLQHPNIVPLLDSGEVPGDPAMGTGPILWYVMPLIDGESLRGRLIRQGPQPIEDALRWTRELADALAHAHDRGIIHRDIKPENVLVSGTALPHAMLADFGVARALAAGGSERLTETGLTLGTPAYMSPEQSVGDAALDGRSDLYSLGCVLYELLTGEPPFTGPTAQAVIAKRLADAVPSPRRLRETIPPGVDHLIRRLLAKSPADRVQSAADLVAALSSPVELRHSELPGQATTQVVTSARWPRRRRAGLAALALLLVAGIAVVVVRARVAPSTPLDPEAVALLPFRVTAPDHSLDYLGEGIVDLLAVKLAGPAGPDAVPPRQLLGFLHYKPGMDVSIDAGNAAARRAGAGLVLDGSLVRSGTGLELSAELRPTDGRGHTVRATVAGNPDSLATLIDRLAARLMAGQTERTVSLGELSTSRAIGEYLQGRAAHRRGQYTESVAHFNAALREDSTFALAALDMLASLRGDDREAKDRAARLAWANRAKLSPRGQALLRAWIGPKYPAPSSMILGLAAWQDAVTAAPDLPDIRFELADRQLHFGALNDIPNAVELAEQNLSRGLELDSSYVWPLDHLLYAKFYLDDTTGFRTLARLWSAQDTISGDRSDYVRWRIAVTLGDSAGVARQRARLSRWQDESVLWLAGAAEADAIGLGDVQLAIKELERRAVTGPKMYDARQRWRDWLLNAGRPSEARALTDSLASGEPFPGWDRVTRIDDALFWDGDSTAAAADVHALAVAAGKRTTDSVATGARSRGFCRLGFWSLAHGDRPGVRLWSSRLRGMRLGTTFAYNDDNRALCAYLLDAWSALPDRVGEARSLLQHADSIYLYSDVMDDYLVTNLVTARIREALGDLPGARRTIERVPVELPISPQYQSTYFREQARLELQAGDTASAIRALRRYVALRRDPEPALRAEVDSARAELGVLVSH